MTFTTNPDAPPGCGQLQSVRLPAWCLPPDWPRQGGEFAAARIAWRHGVIEEVTPQEQADNVCRHLVLPAFVQTHAHLDKAFTIARTPSHGPGLLAAIEAVIKDRQHWSADDLRQRMTQGLQAASEAGVTRLRTHIDWMDAAPPMAWQIAGELAQTWAGRVRLERVALVPLRFFADRTVALRIASAVHASGQDAVMGGFIHTSNWSQEALNHLMQAAQSHDLDLDLHVDEELNPRAQGVAAVVRLASELEFSGVIACSHACALAAQPTAQALATLDAMAKQPQIRLISLPATNLLLQDAQTGITPRQRGITLVQEARARGIPVMFGSDNVQDPFCHGGSFDPLQAFTLGVYAAQLDDPFDTWSASICRPDWLSRTPHALPLTKGAPAELVCFEPQPACSWPAWSASRRILQKGHWREPHQNAIKAH